MCSVYGVQFSGHDQQHSARTGPGPAYLRLCPVVKCAIRRVKGWRVTGGGTFAESDNDEDTELESVLTPCLWSVLRLHNPVQLSRATPLH